MSLFPLKTWEARTYGLPPGTDIAYGADFECGKLQMTQQAVDDYGLIPERDFGAWEPVNTDYEHQVRFSPHTVVTIAGIGELSVRHADLSHGGRFYNHHRAGQYASFLTVFAKPSSRLDLPSRSLSIHIAQATYFPTFFMALSKFKNQALATAHAEDVQAAVNRSLRATRD